MATTQDFVRKQRKILNKIKRVNQPLQRAADTTHKDMVQRIHRQGKKANNSKIGNYNSTDEIYIDPATSKKSFPLTGKVNKSDTFKNGKKRKTGFFDSYKAFKQATGRPTGFINLNQNGDLELDFSNRGKTTKVNPTKRIASVDHKDNIDKAEGAESRFGKIYDLTVKEIKKFEDILQKELELALSGLSGI